MRTWTLVFEDTGFFSVAVTPKFRDTFLYKFTGTILGAGNNTIGSVPLADGKFTFMVQSKNDQVTIEVINDTFLPCHLLSVEWEALYTRRSQRV
jgi:hypothetical protein